MRNVSSSLLNLSHEELTVLKVKGNPVQSSEMYLSKWPCALFFCSSENTPALRFSDNHIFITQIHTSNRQIVNFSGSLCLSHTHIDTHTNCQQVMPLVARIHLICISSMLLNHNNGEKQRHSRKTNGKSH